jgi:hypothetical protein
VPQPTTLAILAGLSIVGTLVGVSVGRATLAQINPANFEDRESSFYSDMVPNAPRADWAQVQQQEYQQAAQATAPQTCLGCAWPVAPVPPQDPTVARYDQSIVAVVPPARVERPVRVAAVQPPSEPQPDWKQVERYTQYPVEQPVHVATGTETTSSPDAGDTGTQ